MQKTHPYAILLIALIATAFVASAYGVVSVGVKPGDWIEYKVNVSGNPPEDHAIQWARMQVTDVQDGAIGLDIQSQLLNGTTFPEHIILNLATGVLGDDFFIPKNLNVGDQFYDAIVGNITITGMEQRLAAGAERTVISASTEITTFYWDQETGVLVAATSHLQDYSMATETNGTNIWQPDTQQQPQIFGLDPAVFYAIIVAAVVVLVVAVAVVIWRLRK